MLSIDIRYLKEKDTDVFKNKFSFNKSIKNLADTDDKVNMTVDNYEHKADVETEDKKTVDSILNRIKYNFLNYYLNPNTIAELHKKRKHDKINSNLKKNSKDGNPIDEIEMLRNVKSKPPEESIAERLKLRRQKAETLKRLRREKMKRQREWKD